MISDAFDVDGLRDWLAALGEPRCRVELDLHGAAGRFLAPPEWTTTAADLEASHLLYYVLDGALRAQVGDAERTVTRGGMIWASAGQSIRYWRAATGPLCFYRFRLRVVRDAGPLLLPGGALHLADWPEGAAHFAGLVDEAGRDDALHDTQVRALLASLLVALGRRAAVAVSGAGPSAGQGGERGRGLFPAQREAVERHVEAHPGEWLHVAELAAVAGLSPDYFARLFRRSYGQPVRAWLAARRVATAKVYLRESTLSVSQVADLLGYRDVFYFSKQYKAIAGHAPSEERRPLG